MSPLRTAVRSTSAAVPGGVVDGLEAVQVDDQDARESAVTPAGLLIPVQHQLPAAPVAGSSNVEGNDTIL